jgi:hypothetical protein
MNSIWPIVRIDVPAADDSGNAASNIIEGLSDLVRTDAISREDEG